MCGIVGIWNHASGRPVDRRLFDAVTDALAHRGPDGRGTWHEGPLALGHRRLAILDPTPAGAQPMRHPTRPFVVTFNGEIYNFRELRRELLVHGHAFRTDCDTEVLLAAYARWGAETAVRLRGMFAFALWDGERRELRLVRDRLGIKPLYYSLAGGVVRFASEVRGIIGDPGFPRTPSPDGIASLLALGYIPAPQTAWQGIRQLPPGREVVLAADRPLESAVERPYWRLDPAPAARRAAVSDRDEDADAEFAARWARTLESHLVSDVPVGAFLSGGVDSAAVAAEMSRQRGGNAATFSVGFTERTFDESALAAETARRAGTRHHAVRLDLDLAQTFDSVAAAADEPFADSSALAVWHLCRETSRHVKVALSGDGADELLGGYSTYRATWLAGAYRRLPAAVRAALRWGVARLPAADSRYNLPQFAQRFVHGAEQPAGRDFASWRIHFAGTARDALLRPEWRAAAFDPLRPYAAAFDEAPASATLLQRMLHADLTFYLPSDMLVKVDRMSMAHGLEVRVPFLDHEFVEFARRLPDRHLARLPWAGNKRILRRWIGRRLGPEIARRSKTGFNVPIEKAMRTTLRERLADRLRSRSLIESGPIDVASAERLLASHARREFDAGHALYTLLVLVEWWERCVAGAASSSTRAAGSKAA